MRLTAEMMQDQQCSENIDRSRLCKPNRLLVEGNGYSFESDYSCIIYRKKLPF
ncbi:hypothetical protein ODV97_08750 [Enterococcus gallinarum]|nr:hypothetical protein [Enterococcus gallinarum]